jgi:(p)ppGpp synthase/HD superfamily hydrolase
MFIPGPNKIAISPALHSSPIDFAYMLDNYIFHVLVKAIGLGKETEF